MPKGNDDPTDDVDDIAPPTPHTGGAIDPTETSEGDEQPGSPISRRQLLQAGAIGIASTAAVATVSGSETDHPNTIVFDGTSSSGKSKYTFSVSGGVEDHPDAGPIEVNDTINGSSVTGTVHRDKDTYRFSGQLTALDVGGDATVSLSYGDETDTAADRLQLVAGSDAEIDYTFTATDKIVPVTDVEHAAEDNDEVVENGDGTWTATGYVGNGYGDTFDFWGDIADISPMDGDFTLFLNGTEVTTYDLTGEDPPEQETRQHSYSFEGTGDSWADYYLEVEDGSQMIASTLDGAVIEPDFHWVSDDGTKAAGRVDPGERHAYEFDNLVLDVTIEGEADAFVDGSPSDLDYYPQPGATGDGWKGGFPWQDGEASTTSTDGPVIGGGTGYPSTVTQPEADFVVRTRSELANALSSASAGDVVFVPGGEQISLGNRRYDIPDGVTLASSRGVNGSSGALLYTDYEPWKLLTVSGSGRVTGLRLRGAHPGDDLSGESSSVGVQVFGAGEVDNCDIWGFSYAAIRAASGDGMHVHHNVIRENNRSGYGYGVAAGSGSPVIEYNYFNYNRHGVKTAGENPGYTCRYNHFGPQLTDHRIDMHDPAGVHYEVHNNIVEGYIAAEGSRFESTSRPAVTVRGVPDDVAAISDNWFYNPEEPLASPSGWTDEAITQALVDGWTNVTYSGNYYGENANVTYSDIIPGYDGWRTA